MKPAFSNTATAANAAKAAQKLARKISPAKVAAMILLSQASLAWADDPVVQIGNPSYQGSGCPAGSVSATLSPDATALSLIFDKYSVETGKAASGLGFDQKLCSFQIPVTVPAGYSVTVLRVDYRGYHSLPGGADASFRSTFGFLERWRDHRLGNDLIQQFHGPVEGDFFITQNASASEWSQCDGDVQLRLDIALGLKSNPQGELATVSIDSADMTGEHQMQYVLAWRRCNGQVLRPGQPGHPVGRPGDPRGNGVPRNGGPVQGRPDPLPEQGRPAPIPRRDLGRGWGAARR